MLSLFWAFENRLKLNKLQFLKKNYLVVALFFVLWHRYIASVHNSICSCLYLLTKDFGSVDLSCWDQVWNKNILGQHIRERWKGKLIIFNGIEIEPCLLQTEFENKIEFWKQQVSGWLKKRQRKWTGIYFPYMSTSGEKGGTFSLI